MTLSSPSPMEIGAEAIPPAPGKRLAKKTTRPRDLVSSSPTNAMDTSGARTPDPTKASPSPDAVPEASPVKKPRPARRSAKGSNAKVSRKASKARLSEVSTAKVDMDQIAQRITAQCPNINAAVKVINALRRSIGQPTCLGHIFSDAEVDAAWSHCLRFYDKDSAEPDEGEAIGSEGSDESSSDSDAPPDASPEHSPDASPVNSRSKERRQQRDALLLESLMADPEEDLSGEEDVDEMPEEIGEMPEEIGELGAWPAMDEAIEVDDGYPVEAWVEEQPSSIPGSTGFSSRCSTVMSRLGIGQTLHTEFDDSSKCPPLQPHQEAVAFLLHPKSPVTRLLVDHPTGSGKTREMIRVLDNYFFDPRPKVPIFPKSPVCRNFYAELLRWPSRYRDYFCCMRPADAAIASGRCDWREVRMAMWSINHFLEEELRLLCYAIRDVLELKNAFFMGRVRLGLREEFEAAHPGESMPAAPMRALSYTSAGGSFTQLRSQGDVPRSAMMKIGYIQAGANVYTNKVVVMDEAHNLVRTQTQFGEQLQCLRDLLVKANNLVLAGFTGTPILNQPSEGRQLLDIIKGCNAPVGDEGFMSSFPMRPPKLFPVCLPRGIPDAILTRQLQRQLVVPVVMNGESVRVYDKKRRQGYTGRLLSAYCNACTYFGSFHSGRFGSKERILSNPGECCPKLLAIVTEVAASPEKAVVLIRRQSGYNVILELLRQVAATSNPPFGVATIDELAEYNHVSNIRGEKFRVLVADSLQCSEGVSFLAVRRTFLCDVPGAPSALVQQCGRSIRMFGHRGLPEEEQTVTNRLYIAKLPAWLRSPLANWVYRLFRHVKDGEHETYAKKMLARLNQLGIDSLEELKSRIDAHGELKRTTLHPSMETQRKEPLDHTDLVLFMELAGLWKEPSSQSTPKADAGKSSKFPQFAGQSARFAALASGSQRLAALTSRLGGAGPGPKKTKSTDRLKLSILTASKNLPDAAQAFSAVVEALGVVRRVCEQIDKFIPAAMWQPALEEGLQALRTNSCVFAALRDSAKSAFDAKEGDLKELTAAEVKVLQNNLGKAEKAMSLNSALLIIKEISMQVEAKTEGQEEDEDLKRKVEETVGALLDREQVIAAMKEVAPDAYAARNEGGLKDLTPEQLRALRVTLEKQKGGLSAPWSPVSMVKAIKALYMAESIEEASKGFEGTTADEQAMELLAERTAQFVPALEALREKAMDCELFKRFKDPLIGQGDAAIAEVKDEEDDVYIVEAFDGEVQPVNLPMGWKLEWVSQIRGKVRDQFRFVDPVGRKYYSVAELRVALVGGIEAVQAMRLERQQARQEAAEELKSKRPLSRVVRPPARKRSRW